MCPTLFPISSVNNPRYKSWLRLLDGKGIKKQQEALFAGRIIIHEALRFFPERIAGVLARKETDLDNLDLPEDIPAYLLPADLFSSLDIYGIKEPILLLKAPPFPVWTGTIPEGLTIFLPFQNPINLGTTIRTAAALKAEVVLLEEAASPYLPKSLRASGPAIFQTPVWQGPSLRELAVMTDLPLYALSPNGQPIFSAAFPPALGLVAGPEGPGLDAYWPEKKRYSIPMAPGIDSLNASIAISMAMACRLAQQHLQK